jgi:hypothetical protein
MGRWRGRLAAACTNEGEVGEYSTIQSGAAE